MPPPGRAFDLGQRKRGGDHRGHAAGKLARSTAELSIEQIASEIADAARA